MKEYVATAKWITRDGTLVKREFSGYVKRGAVAMASAFWNEMIHTGSDWIELPTVNKIINGESVGKFIIPEGNNDPITFGEW